MRRAIEIKFPIEIQRQTNNRGTVIVEGEQRCRPSHKPVHTDIKFTTFYQQRPGYVSVDGSWRREEREKNDK